MFTKFTQRQIQNWNLNFLSSTLAHKFPGQAIFQSYLCQINSMKSRGIMTFILILLFEEMECKFVIFHRWCLSWEKSKVVLLISKKKFLYSLWRPNTKLFLQLIYIYFSSSIFHIKYLNIYCSEFKG